MNFDRSRMATVGSTGAFSVGHTLVRTAFIVLVALVAIPTFGQKNLITAKTYAGTHIMKDSGAKEYSRDGLPCSTPSAVAAATKSGNPLQQLDALERMNINTVRGSSQRDNSRPVPFVRPANSEKQSSINFVYHPPASVQAAKKR